MALDYANEAWDFMQTTNMHVPSPGTLQLSRNEYLRFCRAFYRVEIRHSIERPKPVGPHRPRAWNEGEDFLHPLPSYDQEQMGCVLEYQERLFLNTNIVSQLKRGLRFLVKITSDLSYDEKKNLLYAKYGPGEWADLWKSLDADRDWLEEDRQLADDPWVQNEDDGGLIHVFKDRVDAMDLDLGPRGAFMRSISRALADLTTIDFIPTDGLRDRAYVLWDRDRLLQLQAGWVFPPGLLNPMDFLAYESKPRRGPDYRERLAAEKTLKESLQASKEIWDKGGSGYWSADDLSKVVWGGDRWTPHEYPPKDRW
ncbi:hypothetical protein N0V92_001103 [Colletotrichum tropicale]|nr:hypothetical protein N0V92_001103 [Colletotrichum tropicale]